MTTPDNSTVIIVSVADYIPLAKRTLSEKSKFDLNLWHACLGLDSEIGEIADALKRAVFYHSDIIDFSFDHVDTTNILEEVGDTFWYTHVPLHFLKLDIEDVQVRVDKFKEFDINLTGAEIAELYGAFWQTASRISAILKLWISGKPDVNELAEMRTDLVNDIAALYILGSQYCSCLLKTRVDCYDIMRANITKLAKRYPDRFTDWHAVNRDLVAEREALENA